MLHVSALSAFVWWNWSTRWKRITNETSAFPLSLSSVRPFSCNNSSTPKRIFVKCQMLTSSSMTKLQLEPKWDVQNLRLEMQCYIHIYNDEGCLIVMQLWIKAEDGSCKTLLQCPSVLLSALTRVYLSCSSLLTQPLKFQRALHRLNKHEHTFWENTYDGWFYSGVHKSWASGHPGDILYGGAKYLWIQGIKPASYDPSGAWNLGEAHGYLEKLVHPWFCWLV